MLPIRLPSVGPPDLGRLCHLVPIGSFLRICPQCNSLSAVHAVDFPTHGAQCCSSLNRSLSALNVLHEMQDLRSPTPIKRPRTNVGTRSHALRSKDNLAGRFLDKNCKIAEKAPGSRSAMRDYSCHFEKFVQVDSSADLLSNRFGPILCHRDDTQVCTWLPLQRPFPQRPDSMEN